MNAGKMFAGFAAAYFALVFIRDGTAGKLIDDGASFLKHTATGLRGPAKLA